MPFGLCGALRIAIALIAMFVVPPVAVGLLGTIATSWAPPALRRYLCATCWAISADIAVVDAGVGCHADHRVDALCGAFAIRTPNDAIAATHTTPSPA